MPSTPANQRANKVIHELQHAAQQYRIITVNEEIILRTGEQIVRACQLQISASAWQQNFSLMAEHVSKWCEKRRSEISLALVDLRSEKIVFYFVPRSDQFDFNLATEQAELDIFLNTRGAIGYTESRQVPGWELDRFVSDRAFRVWPPD
jgi:hypothetical protein